MSHRVLRPATRRGRRTIGVGRFDLGLVPFDKMSGNGWRYDASQLLRFYAVLEVIVQLYCGSIVSALIRNT